MKRITQAPSATLLFGDAIHQALEADGRTYLAGSARLGHEELVALFRSALRQRIAREDPDGRFLSLFDVGALYDDGEIILRAYVERIQQHYLPASVEETFGTGADLPIPGMDAWTFTGRLDARVRMPGGWALLDFKTGKAWPTGEEHTKDQATAYLWAETHLRPHPAGTVLFVLLPLKTLATGERICAPELRRTKRTEAQRYAYGEHLRTVAEGITEAKATGDFPAKVSPLCAWCGVLGACEPGRAYLQRTKREPMVPVLLAEEVEHA